MDWAFFPEAKNKNTIVSGFEVPRLAACVYSPNSICRATTRHALAHAFLAQEKVATCYVAPVGQHLATRSSRKARLARHVFRGVSSIRLERSEPEGVIPHKIHPSPLKLALPAARLGGQPSLPWSPL